MRNLPRFAAISMLSFTSSLGTALAADSFRFQDASGNLDLLYGDKPVYRLMTYYDGKDSTKKVFHHVYGFHGEGFITKGAGRLWGHHRGIWLGWSDVTSQGKTENFWECPDGNHQTHSGYLPEREAANGTFARRASKTDWIDRTGTLMGQDIREVTAWFPADGMLALDYAVQVISPKGDMTVKATPAHGGLQFRSDSQDDTATVIMPKDAVLQPADVIGVKDSNSWVFEAFNVKESRYGVLAMDHPSSPRPTKQNFKGYGRIGAYWGGQNGTTIKEGEPWKAWERFLVFDLAKFPDLNQTALQDYYDAYRESPPQATLPTSTTALSTRKAIRPDLGPARIRILFGVQGNARILFGNGQGWVGADGKFSGSPGFPAP